MIIQKKKKTKNIKPYDFDIQLIYRCPNCNLEHWLSLIETQTKGFKVVCDCSHIFRVKTIKGIDIVFEQDAAALETKEEKIENADIKEPIVESVDTPKEKVVPTDLFNKCIPTLTSYGFTKKEAQELIYSTYQANDFTEIGAFLKLCFSNIEIGS